MRKNELLVIGIILAGIFLLLGGASIFSQLSISGYSYPTFASPVFSWLKCTDEATAPGSIKTIPESGTTIECPTIASQECIVKITSPSLSDWTTARRIKYKIDGGTELFREFSRNAETFEISFQPGSSLFIVWQARLFFPPVWGDHQDTPSANYQLLSYRRFVIVEENVLGGGGFTRVEGCQIPYEYYRDAVISIKDLRNIDFRVGDELAPGEYVNRITGFVASPTALIEDYGGKEAYCINRQMYAIGEVTLGNGDKYKVVQADYGAVLGQVTCCNGEQTPTQICQDHEWIPLDQSECDIFTPCPSSTQCIRDPDNPSRLIRYGCVEGQCVKVVDKEAECILDSDCTTKYGEGYVCFVDYGGCESACQYAGDPGGGDPTNPQECEDKGGTWIIEEVCGFSCRIGLSGPTVREYCKMPGEIPWIWIGILGAGGLLTYALVKKKRRK
jgi:hypothetical protein